MKRPVKKRRSTTGEKLRETINEMARLHKLRFESFKRMESAYIKGALHDRDLLATQATVHAAEVHALTHRLVEKQLRLRTAISLVKAARQNEWTPACDQEFASVQEAAK